MKKLLTLLCAFAALTACNRSTQPENLMMVSIEPLKYIVEGIVGDDFEVATIVPAGASPETYEPTPAQMEQMEAAKMVFAVGLIGFEQNTIERLTESTDVAYVNLSEGIAPFGCARRSECQKADSECVKAKKFHEEQCPDRPAPKCGECPKPADCPKAAKCDNAAECPKVGNCPKAAECPKTAKCEECPRAAECPKAGNCPKQKGCVKAADCPKLAECPKAGECSKTPKCEKPATCTKSAKCDKSAACPKTQKCEQAPKCDQAPQCPKEQKCGQAPQCPKTQKCDQAPKCPKAPKAPQCKEHKHGHQHGPHHAHRHAHGERNPHLWTSPRMLRQMATTAYEHIARVYPDSTKYQANYNALMTRLDSLEARVSRRLSEASSCAFVIYHPTFGYLAAEHGLFEIPVEIHGKEPSADHLRRVVDVARKLGAQKVFYQREFPRSVVEAVAGELEVEPIEVDILSGDVEAMIYGFADKLAQ